MEHYELAQQTLRLGGALIDLSRPQVMGILNVTPDSFFAGSRVQAADALLRRAEAMLEEGATFLDVGGYSTRPGADEIPLEDELQRVQNAVRTLKLRFPDAHLSVDTFRAQVAEAAVAEGADMINDVSGGNLDDAMFDTVARLNVPYVLMHMRGTPQTMKTLNQYDDLLLDVIGELQAKIHRLNEQGVSDILVDPGFGFAKNIPQNFRLLRRLEEFRILNRPLLIGVSRKSMIYKTLRITPEDALNGTSVLHAVALLKGAAILRVHDVKAAVEAVTLINQITNA